MILIQIWAKENSKKFLKTLYQISIMNVDAQCFGKTVANGIQQYIKRETYDN